MWISDKFLELFNINRESFDLLKGELVKAQIERDVIKAELITTKANYAWLTTQVNDLQNQNKVLLEKAYNIRVPVPEIVRNLPLPAIDFHSDLFNDVGDDMAKKLGFPVLDN